MLKFYSNFFLHLKKQYLHILRFHKKLISLLYTLKLYLQYINHNIPFHPPKKRSFLDKMKIKQNRIPFDCIEL